MEHGVLFKLGLLTATPGAIEELTKAEQFPQEFLSRHSRGDWGEMQEEDEKANDLAVMDGSRVFSAYLLRTGVKIWVITEAGRHNTCILLPDEY